MARFALIEDNPQNMMLARDLLTLRGHEVFCFEDAQDVLENLPGREVDVILLDIQLPRMDGFELAKMLRNKEEFATTPIVALTALAMEEDREKAEKIGLEGYLTKPINTRTFAAEVEEFLPEDKK